MRLFDAHLHALVSSCHYADRSQNSIHRFEAYRAT
jgi:hypothetical protein